MKNIPIHSEEREKDVQKVANAVLERSTLFYDNPNGAYESTCPYCYAEEHRGGFEHIQALMSELKHKTDCVYLVAKDLSANI